MAAAETEKSVKLPDIHAKGIYEGKFTDRNREIRAAGKVTETSDSAANCMKPVDRPDSPDIVRKFRASLQPEAGKMRIFYGKANDPHLRWAANMTHGLNTHPSFVAGELLNPDPKTRFQQGLFNKKESVYASVRRAPIGSCHDPRPGLPHNLDPVTFTFGIRTEKDGSAGELLNPNKTTEEVNEESEQGRELYRKTHWHFKEGEQYERNYTAPNFTRTAKFGIPTPHENDGRHARKTLKWLPDTKMEKSAGIVSKRVDDFRERTQPQLGKVHDPIKDTLNVKPDHTFGILVKPDEYGVGDLLHERGPGTYLRGKDRQRGVLAAVRHHLKKANYHNFQDLLSAFRYYDKDGSGKINMDDLREVCVQFNLPVEPELLEQLMDYCDLDKDGLISYVEFANFLNWKDKMPSGFERSRAEDAERSATPQRLLKQIDKAIGEHRTSASMINATVGRYSTKEYRTYGVPTVRTDLPAPKVKRVADRTNYGDESHAHGLVNPSIYTNHGVYEKDFLLPRSRAEIWGIFTNIGVEMKQELFDEVCNIAASSHPKGLVSVESFRNVLDQMQGAEVQKANAQMIY